MYVCINIHINKHIHMNMRLQIICIPRAESSLANVMSKARSQRHSLQIRPRLPHNTPKRRRKHTFSFITRISGLTTEPKTQCMPCMGVMW